VLRKIVQQLQTRNSELAAQNSQLRTPSYQPCSLLSGTGRRRPVVAQVGHACSVTLVWLSVVLLLAAGCGPSTRVSSEPAIPPTGVSTPIEPDQVDTPLRFGRAQGNDVRFERISVKEGLSQSSVLSILQDDKGFMWFGTEDGLNRYNGYEFTVYKHDPDDPHSLSQRAIGSIYEDQMGLLWIRGGIGGDVSLDRYDRETERFTHYMLYDADDPESASSDFVWVLYEDSGGTVWAGTYKSGLYQYDREADRFIHYRHDPHDPQSLSDDRVYAIYEDRAGAFWIGTKGGLDRFDRKTGRFAHYRHNSDDPQSLGSDLVQLIYEDQAGRFWITTFGVGLEQLDRETGRIVARYQHDPDDPQSIDTTNRVLEIYEDRLGFLWIRHFDGRLDRFDPHVGAFARYRHNPDDPRSLSDNVVHFVAEDRSGNLWIGTGKGLDRYDRQADHFVHYRNDPDDPHSLSGDTVISFYEDRAGVLWFGVDGRGLDLYDPKRAKFALYQIDPDRAEENVGRHGYRAQSVRPAE
jgi:two-component system sensor histidine kinase ChiS